MSTIEFIQFSKDLSKFVVGAEGNTSWKLDDFNFVIKSSGSRLSQMNEESLVNCTLEGISTSDKKNRPSMEVGFHAWLYKNTKCKVIAHTHPTNVMKLLCSSKLTKAFATKRLFPDQVVFNGRDACIVPYATPGIPLLSKLISSVTDYKDKTKTDPKLILLQNHGIICCSNSFSEALIMTEICDKAAEIFYGCLLSNQSITYLSDNEIGELQSSEDEKYRRNYP